MDLRKDLRTISSSDTILYSRKLKSRGVLTFGETPELSGSGAEVSLSRSACSLPYLWVKPGEDEGALGLCPHEGCLMMLQLLVSSFADEHERDTFKVKAAGFRIQTVTGMMEK